MQNPYINNQINPQINNFSHNNIAQFGSNSNPNQFYGQIFPTSQG